MSYVTQGSGKASDGGPNTKMILSIVLGILALIFVVQNSKSGTIHFLLFKFTAPVWIAFLLILTAGAVVGYVLRGVRQDRKAAKNSTDSGF